MAIRFEKWASRSIRESQRLHYLESLQDSKRSSILAQRIIASAGRILFDAQDLYFFHGDILYICYVIGICDCSGLPVLV